MDNGILPTSNASASLIQTQTMPQSPGPTQYNYTFPRFGMNPTGEITRSTGRFSLKHDDRSYKDFYALNLYDQALFTYESSNGYFDGTYLVFVQREEYYDERRKISQRSAPAFKSIVDAMVGPVFEKALSRATNNQIFDLFIQNADNTGTTLQDINETCQTHARVLGVSFVVMDNLTGAEDTNIMKDILDNRMFPYIYEKLPQEVYKWHTNNWGKLETITFFDKQVRIEESGKRSLRTYYRYWDNQGWKLYWERRNERSGTVEEVVESQGVHGLGFLPIYPVLDYVKSNNLTNFPVPPLRALVNDAFILFNSRSLVKNLELYNFPILSLSNFDQNQLALGVTNALNSTGDSKFPPNFIVPPSTSIEVLTANCEKLEQKMYEYAQQHGYIAAKGTQSGIKAEWDFRGTNSVLTKTAYAGKKMEEWCAKTFGAYTGKEISFEVDYPSEFSSVYSKDRMTSALATLKEMPPKPLEIELWKETTSVFFEDDIERADRINASIDMEYANSLKDPEEVLPENPVAGVTGVAGPVEKPAEAQPSAVKDLINSVVEKLGKKPKNKETEWKTE